MRQGAMLNAYPDSLGRNLAQTVQFLSHPELKDAFNSFYILPSVFNTDLDHGFSIINYELCTELAEKKDLNALRALGLDLTFDMILNHISVLSPQFQDILKHGDKSENIGFFINWNQFWSGMGPLEADGCIHPAPEYFHSLSIHKDRLPVLMARMPDGREMPFWCSFYQQTVYPEPDLFDLLDAAGGHYQTAKRLSDHIVQQLRAGCTPDNMDWTGFESCRDAASAWLKANRHYLGQLDLDVRSPKVWEWYDSVFEQLAGHGASIIRLDAFPRLHKEPGRTNFMNEPESWDILGRLQDMAGAHGLTVLPEIHSPYSTMAHRKIAAAGAMPYDYFLPGLLIDAMDTGDAGWLYTWLKEQLTLGIRPVNMLGSHDGIPIRDLRGLLPDERIDAMAERVVERGGRRKLIHGVCTETYQLITTYFEALGRDEQKLLAARAIQMFMPGTPQVWYLDLLAGLNDEEALRRIPKPDDREVNRHSYALEEAEAQLSRPIVQKQIELLRMRSGHPAFAMESVITAEQPDMNRLCIERRNGDAWARLEVDVKTASYHIELSGTAY